MTVWSRLTGQGVPDPDLVCADLRDDVKARSVLLLMVVGDGLDVVGAAPTGGPRERLGLDEGVVGVVVGAAEARLTDSDSPRLAWFRDLCGLGPGEAPARAVVPGRDLDGVVVALLSVFRDQRFAEHEVELLQEAADGWAIRAQADELHRDMAGRRSDRDRHIAKAVAAEETERRRLAYDLHDGVATALASASFHLASAELTLGEGQVTAQEQVRTARDLVDLAYDQTRSAITGLHSLVLSDLGLVAAIESLARGAAGVEVQVLADPPEDFRSLPAHTAAALHRIAAESLRNVAKHAQADTALISLRRIGDLVVLGCSDDGVGFDAVGVRAEGAGHYGLSSIAERCALIGASLEIDSQPGRGTTVIVEVPLGA